MKTIACIFLVGVLLLVTLCAILWFTCRKPCGCNGLVACKECGGRLSLGPDKK
jgi:hypothetical protein